MSQLSQSFCLLLDPEVETDLPTQSTSQGGRYLLLSGRECLINRQGKLSRPQKGGDSPIQLEVIRSGTRKSLLMITESTARVTVNGLRAACFCVLNSGDVIRIDENVLHLSLLNRVYVGPPAKSHLNTTCGYCRVPIRAEAGMRVYVCPNCELPTHCHDQKIPVEKRLECAKLSSHCGHCQAAIIESEGFTHVPTL